MYLKNESTNQNGLQRTKKKDNVLLTRYTNFNILHNNNERVAYIRDSYLFAMFTFSMMDIGLLTQKFFGVKAITLIPLPINKLWKRHFDVIYFSFYNISNKSLIILLSIM